MRTASTIDTGSARHRSGKPARSGSWAVVSAVLLALAPKCPFCWAAYMSAFGSLGISVRIPYQPWLLPLMAGLLAVNLAALFLRARARRRYGPFALCFLGVIAIAIGKFVLPSGGLLMASGLVAIVAGSLWNAHGRRPGAGARHEPASGSRQTGSSAA